MPCYHPIPVWQKRDQNGLPEFTKNGKKSLTFNNSNAILSSKFDIPCGQCIGCRQAKSLDWAIRCIHEAKFHEYNYFITLTYNDENLPENGSLCKRDLTLFFKRLRKRLGNGIRYYGVGEYGTNYLRPHYHILLYMLENFQDIVKAYSKDYKGRVGKVDFFQSDILDEIWSHGYCLITDISFNTAAYVARYIHKRHYGTNADAHYGDRIPEFAVMSRRPGIGRKFYDKYRSDLYNYDQCVVREGFILKPPKYYDRIYDIDNPEHLKKLKEARKLKALSHTNDTTPERLSARKECQREKFLRTKKRNFEKFG